MNEGFGWNFWGFFVLAAAWCAGYFLWAVWRNRREADGEGSLGVRDGRDSAEPEGRELGPGVSPGAQGVSDTTPGTPANPDGSTR